MDLEFAIFMSPDETVALIDSALPDIGGIEWIRKTDAVRSQPSEAIDGRVSAKGVIRVS
jgi:hypothetical protein